LQALAGSEGPLQLQRDTLHALPMPALELHNNPGLLWQQQQITVMEKERRLEANNLLPDLSFGYFNQSLIGSALNSSGTPLATGSDRFQGFHVGIAIPLWAGPFSAKVKAAEQKRRQADLSYQYASQELKGRWQQACEQLAKYKSSLDYYTSTAMPNALLIQQQATLGYEKGDISYTTWLLSLQEVFTIRETYLQTVREYNQAVLMIQLLQGV
jgi:cobalt-zinc-cadmium resistance protein CzcA